MVDVGKLFEFVDSHYMDYVDILGDLISVPTVSAVGEHMSEGAELVASLLKERGVKVGVESFGGHPVVFGEVGSGDKTVLIYNHYDVQPPEPLDLWESPPFEMTRKNGFLFGRGVADNKGNIAARIGALDALLPYLDELGLKVKFVVEGEEEIGSPNFLKAIEEKRDFLTAQGGIWETGYVGRTGRLGITLGFKGMLYLELTVKGANRDSHSGSAPLIPNPVWKLVRLLSLLKREDGYVPIPGFYEDIDKEFLEMADELIQKLDPSQLEKMKEDLGIKEFVGGLKGYDAYKALLTSPSLNVCGIYSGYIGKGSKTVIPSYAMAKIDIRPVPGQDPGKLLEKTKKYLVENGFDDVDIEVHSMYPSGYSKPDEAIVKASISAAVDVYGSDPQVTPLSGGSGPIYMFTNLLGIPMTGAGVGYYGSKSHAPNENIRVEDFVKSMKHVALTLVRFSEIL